jgi:hypothetical protein
MDALTYLIVEYNGLCGPLPNMRPGYPYGIGVAGTNLGNECLTASPTATPTTSAPTVTTAAPTTSAPTVTTVAPTTTAPTTAAPTVAPTTSAPTTTPLPCCERLRLNPIFCGLERLDRAMMAATCQVCGPAPWSN